MKTIVFALLALVALTPLLQAQGPGNSLRNARTQVAGPNAPTGYPDFSYLSRGFVDENGRVTQYAASTAPTIAPRNNVISTGQTQYVWLDVNVQPPPDGGNLAASNSITGVANVALIPIATLTDGTAAAKTRALMDDTPAGEWSAIGGGTADPTPANSPTYARKGTNSLKLPFLATAVAGDGAKFTAFSGEDWETGTTVSVGAWIMSSEPLAASEVVLKTVDSTGDVSFNMPAIPVAYKWTWVEWDVTGLTGGTGDAVTNVKLALSTAGAANHGAFDLYVDGMYKWASTEEVALGVDLVDSPGAVRSMLVQVKTDAGTTAHTWSAKVEDTDFFVHSESGNDFLVTITNLSTFTGFVLVCHKP